MIFIDSNIPMYLVGASPMHQAQAQALIARANTMREKLVTSVEIFQEVLHRYVSIRYLGLMFAFYRNGTTVFSAASM